MTKELEKAKDPGLPVDFDDMAQDAKLGGEVGMKDIAIPFLYVLQTNSPQVNADHGKYVRGATAGMLYLSVIEKAFEGREMGIKIVPCHYQRNITEWKPRESGGGIVKVHDIDSPIIKQSTPNEKGIPVLPNGNLLVETAVHYVLVNSGEPGSVWYQAIMPLKSTALKVSRRLNSAIAVLRVPGRPEMAAPRFLYAWNLKSVKEQKDDQVWSSPAFALAGVVDQITYKAARAYSMIAATGALQATEQADDHSAPAAAKGGKLPLDDEIPFAPEFR